jgi:long-chain acyl-CoA synthetase
VAAVNYPDVINLFTRVIGDSNAGFNRVEQVKQFRLLSSEWTVDSGELTPKMSMKRKSIMEKYDTFISDIYA